MSGEYLGTLAEDDPLYPYLTHNVLGKVLGTKCEHPVFDVFRLGENPSNWSIFRYTERSNNITLVSKFYGDKWLDGREVGNVELRTWLMNREFTSLEFLRSCGFNTPPYTIVRPLATCASINCALIEEYAVGCNLNQVIIESIKSRDETLLHDYLSDVALFFATLHRCPHPSWLSVPEQSSFLKKIGNDLAACQIITSDHYCRLATLSTDWTAVLQSSISVPVVLHGDARPIHFIFGHEHEMTLIDLEHMRLGDRAEDIGHFVGELRHLFLWHGSTTREAMPFIQHFCAYYMSRLPATEDIYSFLARIRYYAACFEFMIGQIYWMDITYRRALIADAEAMLLAPQGGDGVNPMWTNI